MAKNYVQKGETIEHTAGADIVSGEVVLLNDMIGVAITDIANGAVGALATEGVFEVPKLSTDTMGGVLRLTSIMALAKCRTPPPRSMAVRRSGKLQAVVIPP